MQVTIIVTQSKSIGWDRRIVKVEIGENCPVCGGPRGEPYPYNFHEDGEWLTVDRWDNTCGHVDHYQDVYKEAQERLTSGTENWLLPTL